MRDDEISIVERFVALQGEGRNLGRPYAFIRVGGCPLRCLHCDSEYTFQPGKESVVKVDDVIDWAITQNPEWISITGGEPLIYIPQLRKMLKAINKYGLKSHVETSGRYYDEECHHFSDIWSPDAKTPCTREDRAEDWQSWVYKMRPQDQVKCLIKDEVDLDYAYGVNEALRDTGCETILQPFNQNVESDKTDGIGMAAKIIKDWKVVGLLEQTKHLEFMLLEDMKVRHWVNVRITPQLHVLMHGNRQGV